MANDFWGTGDQKGSAQVLPTLMAGKSDLRVGLASAKQNAGRQLKALPGRRCFDHRPGNHLSLIKPSLTALATKERHRNNQYRIPAEGWFELCDSFGQHSSKHISRWPHAVKFEEVH